MEILHKQMKSIDAQIVEIELIKIIDEINKNISKNEIDIDGDCCPNKIGISSQILVTVISRISSVLKVNIPTNCYIFYDNKNHKQLTIKEATQKLIEKAKNGN